MRKLLCCFMVVVMIFPGLAQALVPPTTMQRVLAGMMEKKMVQRGIASNDPRWAGTLQGSGSSIAGAALGAAAVAAAGVTAPAWATVAATAALGALFAVGIDLAVDGIKWLISPDGSVTYAGNGAPSSVGSGGLGGGSGYYCAGGAGLYCSNDPTSAAAAYFDSINKPQYDGYPYPYPSGCSPTSGSNARCTVPSYTANSNYHPASQNYVYPASTFTVAWFNGTAPSACAAGTVWREGACKAIVLNPLPTTPSTVKGSPSQAADALTAAEKAKPANPALVANIANEAWKAASAKPDFGGLAYDPSNPITAAEAQAQMQASPSTWPTVGDLVSPQVAPASEPASKPWTLPSSATDVVKPADGSNATPPITSPTLDWSVPAYGDQIAKQSVPVSFVPTVFAAPTGCPSPITFQMFGKTSTISYGPFCDLMTMLAPLFLACGAAAAALIFAESLKS